MKPVIQIGASSYVGDFVLPKALVDWEKTNPNIELRITTSDSEDVFRGVVDGSLEAGIIGAALEDERIETEEFIHNADELVLIAHPEHPFSEKGEISAREILDQPFIAREKGSATRMWYRDRLSIVDVPLDDLNIVSEVDSHQAAVSAVEAGAGVAFVLRGAAKDALDLGRVKEIRVKELSPLVGSLYLVHLKEPLLSEDAKRVLEFLRSESKKLAA
ncbi:MAG: LysR substrate-binding domain-containing protein [Candidatus Aquicultorales bacterium]